jgi:hypothetical protein
MIAGRFGLKGTFNITAAFCHALPSWNQSISRISVGARSGRWLDDLDVRIKRVVCFMQRAFGIG